MKQSNKVAAVQMVSGIDVAANLVAAERLILQAADAGARLIVLPENFALMGMTEFDKLDYIEQAGSGLIQDFLAQVSASCNSWIVAGTLPFVSSSKDKILAACFVYDDQGQQVARYDKIHLFDVNVPDSDEQYMESATIEAGNQLLVIDTPFGRLGVAVCYDLRFPELFRQMLSEGMELLAVPAAFTKKTGRDHWELLVRARAVENLCYVIASNQGGDHENGRQTFGDSMIVDPWGQVLTRLESGEGLVTAEIDLDSVKKVRTTFPVIEHRRIQCELA